MQLDQLWRLYRPLRCLFPVQWKVLYIAIDEVSGALSMLTAPLTIWIVCGTRRSDSPVRAS
jgi:hypothetical protein